MFKNVTLAGVIMLTVLFAGIGLVRGCATERVAGSSPHNRGDLRAVMLTAEELKPHVWKGELNRSWYYGESAGKVLESDAIQQRVSVEGGAEVYIKCSEFLSREEALAAATYHATHMAAIFDKGGPEGHTLGETCWISHRSGGFAVLFQQGPLCVLVHSPLSGETERRAMADIAFRMSAKITRVLPEAE